MADADRVALVPQEIGFPTGDTEVVFTLATTDGFKMLNDGNTIILVRNDEGADARSVVVDSVACSHGRDGDITLAVAATKHAAFPRLKPELFNRTAEGASYLGMVFINTAVPTNVYVAAIHMGS